MENKTDCLTCSKIANFKQVLVTYMMFSKKQILIFWRSRKQERRKKITKKTVK